MQRALTQMTTDRSVRRLISWASVALLIVVLIRTVLEHRPEFGDVYAYHRAWDGLYSADVGRPHAFVYSPAAAQAIWPLTLLPFPMFYGLLLATNAAALVYIAGWRWAGWLAALFYPVAQELAIGNIHLLLAASFILALRNPGWWAVAALTKVSPGIGMLYEWRRPRRIAIAIAVPLTLGGVSLLTAPQLWSQWFELLEANWGAEEPLAMVDVPLIYRLPAAAALAIVAGWRRWPSLIPVAMVVALPVIWVSSLSILVASMPHRYPAAHAN